MARIKLTLEQKEANKIARKKAKEQAKEQQRIQSERNQKPVESITINVVWRKSRTWGYNPFLEATVRHTDGTITAIKETCSGCGYDKLSTVVGQLFNEVLKYKLWELRDNNETKDLPYGIDICPDYCGFGQGVGISCYPAICDKIGFIFKQTYNGKSEDGFTVTLK